MINNIKAIHSGDVDMKITCKLTNDSPEHTFFLDLASVYYPVSIDIHNKQAVEAELLKVVAHLTSAASKHTSQVFSIENIGKQNDPSSTFSHVVAWYANDFTSDLQSRIPAEKVEAPFAIQFGYDSHEFRAGHPLFDHLANGVSAKFKKEARETAQRLVSQQKQTFARPQASDLLYDPRKNEVDIEKAKNRMQITDTHLQLLKKTLDDQHRKIRMLQNKVDQLENELAALKDNENLSSSNAEEFKKYIEQRTFHLPFIISQAKSVLEKEARRLAAHSEVEFSTYIHECYQSFATYKNIIEYINALMAFHIYEAAKSYWNACIKEADEKFNKSITKYLKSDQKLATQKKAFLDEKQTSFNRKFKSVGIEIAGHVLQDNQQIKRYFYNSPLDNSARMINTLLLDCANGKRALQLVKQGLNNFDKDFREDPVFKNNPEYSPFTNKPSFLLKNVFTWTKSIKDLFNLLGEQTKRNYYTAPEVSKETSVPDSVYQDFIKKIVNQDSQKNFNTCEKNIKEVEESLSQIDPGKKVELADGSSFQEPNASLKMQIGEFKAFLKEKSREELIVKHSLTGYDSSPSCSRSRSSSPEIEVASPSPAEVPQVPLKEINHHKRAIDKIFKIISNTNFWNSKLHGGGTSKTKTGMKITHNNKDIKVQNTIAEFINIYNDGHTTLHDDSGVYETLYRQLQLTAIKTLNTKKWYHGTLFDPRDKVSYAFYEKIRNSSIENLTDDLNDWIKVSNFPR